MLQAQQWGPASRFVSRLVSSENALDFEDATDIMRTRVEDDEEQNDGGGGIRSRSVVAMVLVVMIYET